MRQLTIAMTTLLDEPTCLAHPHAADTKNRGIILMPASNRYLEGVNISMLKVTQ